MKMFGLVVTVGVGGALGSLARAFLETEIRRRVGHGFPWWGFVINLTGALALGLLLGFATHHHVNEYVVAGIGTGFIGAYTMLAPINIDGLRLATSKQPASAAFATLGGYAAALGAATLGLWLTGGI